MHYRYHADIDYLHTAYSRFRRSMSRQIASRYLFLGIVGVVVFAAVGPSLWNMREVLGTPSGIFSMGAFLVILLGSIMISYGISRRLVRTHLKRHAWHDEMVEQTLDDDGIRSHCTTTNDRVGWQQMSSACRYADGFLLIERTFAYRWLPHAALQGGDLDAVADLIRAKVADYRVSADEDHDRAAYQPPPLFSTMPPSDERESQIPDTMPSTSTYTSTVDAASQFAAFGRQTRYNLRRQSLMLLVGLSMILISVLDRFGPITTTLIAIAYILLFVVLKVALAPRIARRQIQRQMGDNRYVAHWDLSEAGVHEHSDRHSRLYTWPTITTAIDFPDGILLSTHTQRIWLADADSQHGTPDATRAIVRAHVSTYKTVGRRAQDTPQTEDAL